MAGRISESINRGDYEILIRKRGESDYASYCPQLNLMIRGEAHEQVHELMEEKIAHHIQNLNK